MKSDLNTRCFPVELHPHSIKAIKKGHPWVTSDTYTKKFPLHALFLIGTDHTGKEIALLLNDPIHKKVKARVWSLVQPLKEQAFYIKKFLEKKIILAFNKRTSLLKSGERENIYLIFGEGDYLPGLFVVLLGDNLLIQYYASFWNKLESILMDVLIETLNKFLKRTEKLNIWIQDRSLEKRIIPYKSETSDDESSDNLSYDSVIEEYGIKYKIDFDTNRDIGIFTDISSIRKEIFSFFQKTSSVLNLYSYTGSFTLGALSTGKNYVVSVDSSKKNMKWLSKNIDLNKQINKHHHRSLTMTVDQAIKLLIKEEKKFDIIICDPPTASTANKRLSSIASNYKILIPQLIKLLPKRGILIIFNNNHGLNWKKFSLRIEDILATLAEDYFTKILKKLELKEDCPTIPNFQEGNYLKGMAIQIKSKAPRR